MLLRDLKNKYKARKEDSDLAMHFLDVYRHHFKARRKEIKSLLEIGVQYGGSLKMWKDYFPNAQITGMDINPKCKKHKEKRIDIVIGDQADPKTLEKLGNFDIIVDDGGHTMAQQIVSFEVLWDHINRGGVYVLEDLETSYWPKFGGAYGKSATAIQMLKDLVDNINHRATSHKRADDKRFDAKDYHIKSIHFYPSLCLIYKE